jgi:hypothetical protein
MVPLWLKVVYTACVALIAVVYVRRYGPKNLLWFSDIALLLTTLTLWLESPLLASMMAVGTLLPELVWNASFFGRLLTGKRFTALAGYMFDAKLPLWLRGLSLFHVVLPPLLVWLVHRLGYTSWGWVAQTALAWAVLPLSYWLSDPADNVNWVFGLSGRPQTTVPPPLYLLLTMVAFPLLVYLPTHLVLDALLE